MSSGGGKGGADVNYSQSPQQQQAYNMMMPVLGELFGMQPVQGGGGGVGDRPSGTSPGTFLGMNQAGLGQWEQSGTPWQAPAYDQPTADWYSNLSPDVMAGLQQPYIEAQQQGMELLGGSGGSARGGATGAAGAMTGNIMGDMAMNVPLQAWQMGAQGRASEYQANMLPYTGALASLSGTYPDAVVEGGGSNMLGGLGGVGGYLGVGSALGMQSTPLGLMLSYGLGSK